jgi:hypothetical protein
VVKQKIANLVASGGAKYVDDLIGIRECA